MNAATASSSATKSNATTDVAILVALPVRARGAASEPELTAALRRAVFCVRPRPHVRLSSRPIPTAAEDRDDRLAHRGHALEAAWPPSHARRRAYRPSAARGERSLPARCATPARGRSASEPFAPAADRAVRIRGARSLRGPRAPRSSVAVVCDLARRRPPAAAPGHRESARALSPPPERIQRRDSRLSPGSSCPS